MHDTLMSAWTKAHQARQKLLAKVNKVQKFTSINVFGAMVLAYRTSLRYLLIIIMDI